MNERYPGRWKDDGPAFMQIATVLAQHDTRNCGEFYFRPAADEPNVALVCGTGDGVTWHYFIVRHDVDPSRFPSKGATYVRPVADPSSVPAAPY